MDSTNQGITPLTDEDKLKVRLTEINDELEKKMEGVTDPTKLAALQKDAEGLVREAVDKYGTVTPANKIEKGLILYQSDNGGYGMMPLADTEPMTPIEQVTCLIHSLVNLMTTASASLAERGVMAKMAMVRQAALSQAQEQDIKSRLKL